MKLWKSFASVPWALALAAAAPGAIHPQGEFVNFEPPQVVPIAVAKIGSAEYVLACNTPDDSVEIYDSALEQYLGRVAVGLSPVTVRWNADNQSFYTCNYIGDSVSLVSLAPNGTATLQRTVHVGNAPTDIAFRPGSSTDALVTLHDSRSVVTIDKTTLVSSSTQTLSDASPTAGVTWAVKFPRRIEFLSDGRMYVLNTMGGNRTAYDVDLYVDDASDPTKPNLVGGMGSTNTAFATDAGNNRMVVVGGMALNNSPNLGLSAVAGLQFGFVESFLWVVNIPSGVAPTVTDPWSASGQTWRSINLNRDYAAGVPVSTGSRVALPTDVLIVPNGTGGVEYVVVASFGTDRVLVLWEDVNANGGWGRRALDVDTMTGGNDYGATGPRGLAYDDVNDKVWVLCLLDNSLAVCDPDGTSIHNRIALSHDPTPDWIYKGRKFLYAARQTSGSHMVACASCHVDGRTDGLRWDLGEPVSTQMELMTEAIIDENITTYPNTPSGYGGGSLSNPPKFAKDKGVLITQTLQGLVNYHLEPSELQYIATNAPYHWRGDQARFQDFNEAFVGLQGMTNIAPFGEPPMGISEAAIDEYTDFIESIHYPPNPEQELDRKQTGDLGTDPNNLELGGGSLLGMKLYHMAESMSGTNACVHCHTLPEGSSNTFFLQTFGGRVPQENAQLRGLFDREKALVSGFAPTDPTTWTRIADRGLMRDGEGVLSAQEERSVNDFNNGFGLGIGSLTDEAANAAMNEFVRKLDWGVGPLIGRAMTVDINTPANSSMLTKMERAAFDANSGIAVRARLLDLGSFAHQGYWYDVSLSSPAYRTVGGGASISRTALLAQIDADGEWLVFQAVPCGSERRVAHETGQPTPLTGLDPSGIELLRMVPNTAFPEIGLFINHTDPAASDPALFQTLKKMRVLEDAVTGPPALGFGAYEGALGEGDNDRHEPPRRLRVAANDIRHGAKLRIGMKRGLPQNNVFVYVKFDLAATGYRHNGMVVWETTEELDPLMQMAFLNGGPELKYVGDLLESEDEASRNTAAGILNTHHGAYNLFKVKIINQSGTGVEVVDKVMRIHDDRDPANQPPLP